MRRKIVNYLETVQSSDGADLGADSGLHVCGCLALRAAGNFNAVTDTPGQNPKKSIRRRGQEPGIAESLRRLTKPAALSVENFVMCCRFCDNTEENLDSLVPDEAHFHLSCRVYVRNSIFCDTKQRLLARIG